MLSQKKSLLSILILTILCACSKLTNYTGFESRPYVFPGLSAIEERADGGYTLRWPVPTVKKGILYKVFAGPTESDVDFSKQFGSSNKNEFDVAPLGHGERLCFVVRFELDGTNDKNTHTLCTAVVNLAGFSAWEGCSEVTRPEVNSAKIGFTFPQGAESVKITRNGTTAFETQERTAVVFHDQGLSLGESYLYSCFAVARGKPWKGSSEFRVSVDGLPTFDGCSSGEALSSSALLVRYQAPSISKIMRIYANGQLLHTDTTAVGSRSVDLRGLAEGKTYRIRCSTILVSQEVFGQKELDISTQSSQAPLFSGLLTAQEETPGTVGLTWLSSSGQEAKELRVYRKLGLSLDWNSATVTTVSPSLTRTVLTGFGPGLPYTFGVRACTVDGLCDANTNTVTVTMAAATSGPQTPGVSSVRVTNGAATFTVDWDHSQGALFRRRIYGRIVASDGLCYGTVQG